MKLQAFILFLLCPIVLVGQISELVDINTSGDGNPNRLYVTSDDKVFLGETMVMAKTTPMFGMEPV